MSQTFATTREGLVFESPLVSSEESQSVISLDGTVPQQINKFAFLGETGATPLVVTLIPANAPSGLYLLTDFFELVTADSGALMHGSFAFNAPSGPVSGWTTTQTPTVSESKFTSLGQLITQGSFIGTATPTTIDFVTGTAATVTLSFDTPTTLVYNYSGAVIRIA